MNVEELTLEDARELAKDFDNPNPKIESRKELAGYLFCYLYQHLRYEMQEYMERELMDYGGIDDQEYCEQLYKWFEEINLDIN